MAVSHVITFQVMHIWIMWILSVACMMRVHPRARALKLFTCTRPNPFTRTPPQPIRAYSSPAHSRVLVPSPFARTRSQSIRAHSSCRRSRVHHFYPPSQILYGTHHQPSFLPFVCLFVFFVFFFAFRAGDDARAGARDTKFISVFTDEHKVCSYSYGKCHRLLSI